jgi:hypothetical protein
LSYEVIHSEPLKASLNKATVGIKNPNEEMCISRPVRGINIIIIGNSYDHKKVE